MSKLLLLNRAFSRLMLNSVVRRNASTSSRFVSTSGKKDAATMALAKDRRNELCRGCLMENFESLFSGKAIPCLKFIPWEMVPTWSQYCKEEKLEMTESRHLINEELNKKIGIWAVEIELLSDVAYNIDKVVRIGPFDQNPAELTQSYRKALDLAAANGNRTVSFPLISSTFFGYIASRRTFLALNTAREWLEEGENASKIDRIICVILDPKDLHNYEEIIMECFPAKH